VKGFLRMLRGLFVSNPRSGGEVDPGVLAARVRQRKAAARISDEVDRMRETERRTTEAAAQAAMIVKRAWR